MRWLGACATFYVLAIFVVSLATVGADPFHELRGMKIYFYILLLIHAVAQLLLINKVYKLLRLPRVTYSKTLDEGDRPVKITRLSGFAIVLAIANVLGVVFACIAVLSLILLSFLKVWAIVTIAVFFVIALMTAVFNLGSIFLKRLDTSDHV